MGRAPSRRNSPKHSRGNQLRILALVLRYPDQTCHSCLQQQHLQQQQNIVNNNINLNQTFSTDITSLSHHIDLPKVKSFRDSERMEASYHVEAELGSGGFGKVYSGYRKRDWLPVAIKHIMKKKVSSCTVSFAKVIAVLASAVTGMANIELLSR
ncbi:hypothetical protein RRG08_066535 [Elysia crispata]|uniref:non-specific serine/threonine protein kinase n=1 Tax=Elysia crispata TaxID=231223 RepID=A0AAE0ZNM6_9GAST|nr:hypothetical protein RRG08_066535 [Elysia crispata]